MLSQILSNSYSGRQPLHIFSYLLLTMTSFGVEHPFNQFESVVPALSHLKFLATPTLLPVGTK